MLAAHYDSVAAGAGAADDGSGVVILLEIARILKSEPASRFPVILLFDDGEEQSLLGARGFVDHSPDAKNVRWAVNLDARGVSGPSFMYETSSNNLSLIRLYAGSVPVPVTNSLMYSLYTLLPSSTDFSVFRQHHIQGYNLAFVGGTPLYHRSGDVPANTSAASVQQQGSSALALIRALAAGAPLEDQKGDTIYFDAFSHVFWWPKAWTPFLILASFLMLAVAIFRMGQTQWSMSAVLWGALAPFLSMGAAGFLGFMLLKVLMPGALLPPDFPAQPLPYFVGFAGLGLVIAGLTLTWVTQRVPLWGFLVGHWLTWTLIGLLAYVSLFGGSYLALVPALGAALSLLFVVLLGLDKPYAIEICTAIPAALALALWFPLLRLLYEAMGKVSFPMVSVFAAAVLILLFPLFWTRHKFARRLVGVEITVTAICAVVAVLSPRWSARSPFPLNIQYVQDGSGKPHWLLAVRKNRSKVQPLFNEARFSSVSDASASLPWLPSSYPLYSAEAPALGLPLPKIDILTQTFSGGRLYVHAKLLSPRGADRLLMYFSPKAKIVSMRICGQDLAPFPQDTLQYFFGWYRYTSTLVPGGVDVEFVLDASGPRDMYIVDETYSLPKEGAGLLTARPAIASASQDGDSTLLFQQIQLGPTNR